MKSLKTTILRSALAIALSAGAAPYVLTYAVDAQVRTVDVREGKAMNEQGALLLDVREPGEYEAGHAPGSTLIPLAQLKDRLQEIRAYESRPVVVICHSGRRSAQAAEILGQAGFARVYSVQGGMTAWKAAALPVVKGSK